MKDLFPSKVTIEQCQDRYKDYTRDQLIEELVSMNNDVLMMLRVLAEEDSQVGRSVTDGFRDFYEEFGYFMEDSH